MPETLQNEGSGPKVSALPGQPPPAPTELRSPEHKPPPRLQALDALRGFDMFWIIGADWVIRSLPKVHDSAVTRLLARQMEHCKWAGFHFYDLIFPLFVFLVGVSIVFSIPRLKQEKGTPATLKRILIRSVILFALGVFYMGGVANGFENVYLAGVLHRIAVAYCFSALLFCFVPWKPLLLVTALLLTGYWAVMTWVPGPGIGSPSLTEPGRNLAHYIDQRFLPGQKFEGTLLSSAPAVANCLLGTFAGLFLLSPATSRTIKGPILCITGVLMLAVGFVWGSFFPIIKLLWTSSYVLVACGFSALLLGLFYHVIEEWKVRAWAQPFVWIGCNALTIYILGNIVNFHRLALRLTGGDIARLLGHYSELVTRTLALGMAIGVVYFLYRRRIFLRL